MDIKVKEHMDDCNELCKLLQESGVGFADEFRQRCRKQLREVVSKLWDDKQHHMGMTKAKTAIWITLRNGLRVLRVP